MKLFKRGAKTHANEDLVAVFHVGDKRYANIELVYGNNSHLESEEMRQLILAESFISLAEILPQISGDAIGRAIQAELKRFIDMNSNNHYELIENLEATIYEEIDEGKRKELAGYAKTKDVFPIYLTNKKLHKEDYRVRYALQNTGDTKWSPVINLDGLPADYVFPRLLAIFLKYVEEHLDERQVRILRGRLSTEI